MALKRSHLDAILDDLFSAESYRPTVVIMHSMRVCMVHVHVPPHSLRIADNMTS